MTNQTVLNKRSIARSMREAGDARIHRAPAKASDGMSLAFVRAKQFFDFSFYFLLLLFALSLW
jgi:hypothetical protein